MADLERETQSIAQTLKAVVEDNKQLPLCNPSYTYINEHSFLSISSKAKTRYTIFSILSPIPPISRKIIKSISTLHLSLRLQNTGALVELSQSITHVLLEQGLVVLVPTTEGRSALSDIACGPHNAQLVDLPASLIVGNDNVELAFTEFVKLLGLGDMTSLSIRGGK